MTIALLANNTTYVYNLRKEIIQELISLGYRVVIVAELLEYTQELVEMGCILQSIVVGRHGKNPLADICLCKNYYKILKNDKVDIVLTYNIKPNVYGGIACQMLKIPCISNVTGLGTPLENKSWIQFILKRLCKIGFSKVNTVFFQNSANQQFFNDNKLLSNQTHQVLLPGSGINLQDFSYCEYTEDGGVIRFLFVGRIMKEKGIDIFFAAAKKFASNQVKFDVVGGCDDIKYESILQEYEKQGLIIWHGQQKNVKKFYCECNCLLFPSYYPEGMSNVTQEAAATGRPAIVANRPGCKEIVDNGMSGFVVPVNDEDATLLAVENFLKLTFEQRKQMGIAARHKVENEFDRKIVVKKYIEEIERINKKL